MVLYELGPQRESDTQQQQQTGKESDGRDEVGREEKVMKLRDQNKTRLKPCMWPVPSGKWFFVGFFWLICFTDS